MQIGSQLIATVIIGHPLCACGTTMWLVSIEPADWPGSDVRNFECPRCFNIHRVWVQFSAHIASTRRPLNRVGKGKETRHRVR
jgi:hypothetical protein